MADEVLPEDVRLVRTTPEFDETSTPAGLRQAHRVADGVWGRLVVRSGSLVFVFEDEDTHRTLTALDRVVIPPGRPHHVELVGPVGFVVEFHERGH